MTERMALTFATRPRAHDEAGRTLRAVFPAPRVGGPVTPVRAAATFVRPGRVVQLVDTVYLLPGLMRVLHGETRLRDLAARLARCCLPGEVPPGLPLHAVLSRASLRRWAHWRATAPVTGATTHRRALLYPVRAGQGEALARTLGAGVAPGAPAALAAGLVSSTIFARGDVVVRYWEASASQDEELRHISRIVPASGLGARLNELLDVTDDMTTEAGFRRVFTSIGLHPALQDVKEAS